MHDEKGQMGMDREEHARSHPVRARILGLYAQDEQRSLAPDDLLRELSDVEVTAPLVAYHARVLRDTGLLPRAGD
jgi:hypothetical protein